MPCMCLWTLEEELHGVTDNRDPPDVDVESCLQPQKTELLINMCVCACVHTYVHAGNGLRVFCMQGEQALY